MNIRHLEHFLAVAETGSFSRAAERLHLTQSALSRSIQALETEVDGRLLDRVGKRNELTPLGRHVVERARRIVLEASEVRRSAELLRKADGGVMRIGLGSGPGAILMTPLMCHMAQNHPRVRVNITRGPTELQLVQLRARQLDALVVDERRVAPNDDLHIEPVAEMAAAWIARASHPLAHQAAVTLANLLDYPIATTPLSDEVVRLLVERYGPEANPTRIATLQCDDVGGLIDVVSRTNAIFLGVAEDRNAGRSPYFRLTWELKAVSVCHKHRVRLSRHCPCCGKENIRHAAAFVVPGWCTKCGAFLGDDVQASETAAAIEPVELWRARQIHELVRVQQSLEREPSRGMLIGAIEHIVGEMDGGQSARFAKRVNLAKSTVHYWLQSDKTPTLDASLNVASQSGIALHRLLTGDTVDWKPPLQGLQLPLELFKPEGRRSYQPKNIDWEQVDAQLQRWLQEPTPVSVREVSRQLGIEVRQLYLHDNRTTRQIGQRWLAYLKRRKQAKLQDAMPHLEYVGQEVLLAGRSPNLREMSARLPQELVRGIQGLYPVLKEVCQRVSPPALGDREEVQNGALEREN